MTKNHQLVELYSENNEITELMSSIPYDLNILDLSNNYINNIQLCSDSIRILKLKKNSINRICCELSQI